jgi:membrane-bound metal-dependent hydrolase YbcI (DUF457 family)
MNSGEHFLIGLVIFFVYNFITTTLINSVINPIFGISIKVTLFYGIIAITIGSLIPDYIEPAMHYTHRSTFHSRKILDISIKLFSITAIIGLFFASFFYIACFFLGYTFHLFADSTTPMGLPEN